MRSFVPVRSTTSSATCARDEILSISSTAPGDGVLVALLVADEHAHAPAVEVVGYLVELHEAVVEAVELEASLGISLHQASMIARSMRFLRPGLEGAVEVGVAEDSVLSFPSGNRISIQGTLFWVRVPVLSVQRMSMEAQVLDGVELLDDDDLHCGMSTAPPARAGRDEHGRHLGVRPTAMEMAKGNASSQLFLVRPLMRKTAGTMTSMKRMRSHETLCTPLSKAVLVGACERLRGHLAEHGRRSRGHDQARRPTRGDVAPHEDEVRRVGELPRWCWEPAVLLTDALSPVSAPWLTVRSFDETTRRSAERGSCRRRRRAHVSHDEAGEGDLAHAGLRALDALQVALIMSKLHSGVLALLEEAEKSGDEHHREDDDGGRGISCRRGDARMTSVTKEMTASTMRMPVNGSVNDFASRLGTDACLTWWTAFEP